MTGYKAVDAAKDTKTSKREVKTAWHDSRDVSGVRNNGTGDRPTPENREDARRLERKVMNRARKRPPERPESSRTEH